MKQNVLIMKTKNIVKILVFSVLCLQGLNMLRAQDALLRVYSAEICDESSAPVCFSSTYACVRFRNDFGTKDMGGILETASQ